MKTPRRWLWWAIGLMLALAIAVMFFESGPTYKGKSARRWARDFKAKAVSDADAKLAFREMGPEVVPFLLDLIRRDEPALRKAQRWIWKKLPNFFQKKFPLNLPEDFREYQIRVLNLLRYDVGDVITAPVLESLNSKHPEIRETCAWVLGGFKTNASVIVPELIKALDDPDGLVRNFAASSLGDLGTESIAAVPALINVATNDSDTGPDGRSAYVRDAAIRALGKVGTAARDAVPALKQNIESGNQRWMVFSAISLWKIERDPTISFPLLTNQYEYWSDPEKWTILQTFGDMGTNAVLAVPIISNYLHKIEGQAGVFMDEARRESLKALQKIDPSSAETIAREFNLK